MKRCIIYSNCQADGLALFLPKMGFPYEIKVYRNYQLILGEQNPKDLFRDASDCDLFIYQPTDPKHDEFSSDYILGAVLPGYCHPVSFAYVYNHGMFPLIAHGEKFTGASFMDPAYWRMDLKALLYYYDRGQVDFALWSRFLHCLAEQSKRENRCDIKITDWMYESRNTRLLLNVNHPSTALFIELARLVMFYLDLPIRPFDCRTDNENRAGLPCTLPHSKYVADFFETSGREPDPEAHEFYRQQLAQAWEANHPKNGKDT